MRSLKDWQQALKNQSAEILCQDALTRIEASTINAFIDIDSKRLLEQAKQSDGRRSQGKLLSPLDGVCVGIKDTLAVKGESLRAASRILKGFVAPYDAHVVERLKAAGALICGRLNCDEFAMGSSTENSAYGACQNPVDVTRTPGGSSGGSAAAVAGGLVPLSLGSDTGGSVRQPASHCGVVGLKPTYGRVSRFGLVAFASSLDVVGPMAGDVSGCEALYNAIAGYDPKDSTSVERDLEAADPLKDLRGKRVGVVRSYLKSEELHKDVRQTLLDAENTFREIGCKIVDVELPHQSAAIAAYYVLCTAEASSNLARYDGVRFGKRKGEKGGIDQMYAQTRGAFLGEEVKRRILLGTFVLSAGYYDAYTQKAQRVRRLIANDFEAAFADCDIILTPTAPEPAFKLGERKEDPMKLYLSDAFTVSQNLAGIPALSIPGGKSGVLPIGLQLTAPAFCEKDLFEFAYAFEKISKIGGSHD